MWGKWVCHLFLESGKNSVAHQPRCATEFSQMDQVQRLEVRPTDFLWRMLYGAPQNVRILWRMRLWCATELFLWLKIFVAHSPECAPLSGAPQNHMLPIAVFLLVAAPS